jgi:hypothetical protein
VTEEGYHCDHLCIHDSCWIVEISKMAFVACMINLKTGGIGNRLPTEYAVKPNRQTPFPLGFSELQVQLPV